jgi:ABC-type sugar transport system substrate-binding protein
LQRNPHWWPPEIDKKIEAEAAKLGVDYQVVGPEGGDIAKQVEMIENYVSQKVDVLAASSLGPATCQQSTTPSARESKL